MEIKNKIKDLANKVLERPIKSAITLGLAGLVAVTALKDNVHFGSVNIYNVQGNHYVWGIFPETKIRGKEAKGNIYTFGLIAGRNVVSDSTNYEGNLNFYSLIFGGNKLGNNVLITGDINSFGIIAENIDGGTLGKNSHLGLKNYKHKVKQEKQ